MITRLKALCAALTPWQAGLVLATFIITAIGAFALAWAFARWNRRKGVDVMPAAVI